jgi:multiple sugar transport system substrate-binding protein
VSAVQRDAAVELAFRIVLRGVAHEELRMNEQRTSQSNDALASLVEDLTNGRLDRRDFARRAFGLGLSASAIAGLLMRAGAVGAHQAGTPEPIVEQLDLANLSPEVPDPSEPVTISFASWVGDSATMMGLRDQFQELHPNITVEFVNVPFEQIEQKLTTQIAGGNPPDTAFLSSGSVAAFASRNALVPLDPYIEKSIAVDPDDYVDAFRVSVIFEDQMYALPINGESTALFYRTDLFEAAGISEPPGTWEAFEEAAQALTIAEERQYGYILFAPEAAYNWFPWLWQAGGSLLSEDGQEVLWDSEAGKLAAEFYVGLREYSPPDYFNSNAYDGRVAFATGQVGMYMAGSWLISVLQSEFPDIEGKWTTAPLPRQERCATTIAGDALLIFAQSDKQDAAWKWIEFLSAPQNMLLWNLGTAEDPGSLLPPRVSLLDDPRIFEHSPLLQGFAEAMICGVVDTVSNPQWPEIQEALNDALGRAIYGEVDPSTAIEEAAEEARNIIAEG